MFNIILKNKYSPIEFKSMLIWNSDSVDADDVDAGDGGGARSFGSRNVGKTDAIGRCGSPWFWFGCRWPTFAIWLGAMSAFCWAIDTIGWFIRVAAFPIILAP